MRITVGAHPDLPMPFSNGPEEPTPPAKGLREPLRLMTQQMERGYAAFGALISYWRGRSGLSGDQLIAIASWGLGEKSWLNSGVLSRIENAKQARGAGLRHLLAFDAANRAIWTWQTKGPEGAWAAFGPHTVWGVRDQWLNDAIWLPAPDEPTLPLEFAEFAEVLVGLLDLPYLGAVSLAGSDAAAMSARLGDILNTALADQAMPPREAMAEMLKAYPSKDPDRQSRLMALVMATGTLTRDELEAELYAIAETIRVLRDLRPGSYGPGELAAELSSPPPPTD